MEILTEKISQLVWDSKYRYKQESTIIDQTINDTWVRVAKAVAKAEKQGERLHWEREFLSILENFQFLPGGRILAGAGTTHQVTLFNCFVMAITQDSLPGIFKALEEGALTLQQGGGVGYDFSVLRPKGMMAKKTGIPAAGPVSFMRIWDTMCSVLLSTGTRRGAMMGILRCDHPDIEEFIRAKGNPLELRHFNVSVMVTDQFMKAVAEDANWPLSFDSENHYSAPSKKPAKKVYRTIKARKLWQEIIRRAYDYAEPGVLFADTINRMNNLWYCETIRATNPCGEIPLPEYGACNLGAINLTQFVRQPFTSDAKMAWEALEQTAAIATRFLDNVIDISHYPLSMQHEQAFGTRRIGLGITGLADLFVMLQITYGSKASIELADEIMKRIKNVTWKISIELGKEKGVFPFFAKAYLQGEFVKSLDESIKNDIAKYGIRNSHHNTVAPTGTISLLANNVSNGIEPIFRAIYDRHVKGIDGELSTIKVYDYACRQYQASQRNELPDAFVDASMLDPQIHLEMQAVIQRHVDNAISKTINLPRDFPFEKLSDVYTKSYELGLKGCTIYRPNPITGSVLEPSEPEEKFSTDRCCQFDE